MTTPRDIIIQALKDTGVLGVGQTPLAEDINDAFVKMNWMIGQWRRKRYLMYRLLDLSITSDGSPAYSIGPGAQFPRPARPDRIEAAYIRLLPQTGGGGGGTGGNSGTDFNFDFNTDFGPLGGLPSQNAQNVDYPLVILQSREDYSRIGMKFIGTFPYALFYDPGFPTGTVYPWPVPQASIYELHILIKDDLQQFGNLSEEIILPDEYMAAIHYNLVVRLGPAYQKQADPAIVALAIDSLETLRKANVAIPRLMMPGNLVRPGVYNPYSDNIQ